MLENNEPYKELGATYLDERIKPQVIRRMKQRIEQLGYRVTIEPVLAASPG